MKISKKMTRTQFAAQVVKQLEQAGISCVLVGGSCVSIYTNERYRSNDLDFVSPYSAQAITKSLQEIGFAKDGKYFRHSDSEFYVEFPSGPPAIGNQVPVKPEGSIVVDGTKIILYSPTQCVMDRLASWYHWHDRQSFIHALWVAHRQPINLDKIKKWSQSEGELEKYEEFHREYKKPKK